VSAAEAPRRGLGRGLSALLGPGPDSGAAAPPAARGASAIPVAAIEPGRFQPRRSFPPEELAELAESIKAQGVLQPILVRRDPADRNRYQLIAGERRWRAAQAARLHEIPAVVRELSDREALEAALVENLQRQDLDPLEEAEAFHRLATEFRHTQEAIAAALGKSRAHVANTVRLLALPDEVKAMLRARALDAGHARALLGAADPVALARRIVAEGLSVRRAEALAREAKGRVRKVRLARKGDGLLRDADTRALERRLEEATGLKVTLAHRAGGQSGSVTFAYTTLDQLDALLVKLRSGG
jgi:ParB family chromosome partitioning protein